VSDRERELPLLRQSFNPGRAQFEQPGQGGNPLELERDFRAQLGITLADYSLLAQGPLHPREQYSFGVNAVVARFGVMALWSRDGFYLHTLINRSAVQISMNFLAGPGSLPALAGASSPVPESITGVTSTVTTTQGDSATATGFNFNLTSQQEYKPNPLIWVPANRVLAIDCNVVNTAIFALLEVSQPRTP
jgi:hypothetical protein